MNEPAGVQESGERSTPETERRLLDFSPGDDICGTFALVEKALRSTRNGNQYLVLKLRDCTGERNALWFSMPPGAQELLNGAQLVSIGGYVDNSPMYRGDIKIQSCEAAPAPDDLTPYLSPTPADHVAHKARFLDVIRSVRNPHLKALLKEIFTPGGEIWPRFQTAPAAKGMHHAYRGGLLEHSGEVAILCERAASTLPHLDRDLLITTALLHDIGKLEEMESELKSGEYTAAGRLVGHVVLGTCSVAAAAERIEGFPAQLKHEIMHLILSHHGRLEHGAARFPMCGEAIVLSLCDLMSAKLAQCREEAGNCEDDFPKMYGWESERAYLGSVRRMMGETDS